MRMTPRRRVAAFVYRVVNMATATSEGPFACLVVSQAGHLTFRDSVGWAARLSPLRQTGEKHRATGQAVLPDPLIDYKSTTMLVCRVCLVLLSQMRMVICRAMIRILWPAAFWKSGIRLVTSGSPVKLL